jgi:hypothetical protein
MLLLPVNAARECKAFRNQTLVEFAVSLAPFYSFIRIELAILDNRDCKRIVSSNELL